MLLRKSSVKYLQKHKLQSLLAVLGIALGIAITIAIDLSIESSKRSFDLSVNRITGKASHQILSKNSKYIDENIYIQLKRKLGIQRAAPVIEAFLPLVSDEQIKNSDQATSITEVSKKKDILKLLAIDPFAERGFRLIKQDFPTKTNLLESSEFARAVLSKTTAEKLNIQADDLITVRVGSLLKQIQIIGFITEESSNYDSLIIMDIADAQKLLGLKGFLSHIDLISGEKDIFINSTGTQIQANKLLSLLSDKNLKIEKSEAKSESLKQITKSFDLNLTALSFLALIVAVFLIYNSLSFSVVQRRRLLAVLRTLGTSRKQIIEMIIQEAIIFAILGIGIGIALGIALSQALNALVSQTINDIYFTVELQENHISILSLLKGAALGLVASFAAAILPAIDASRSSPLLALSRSSFELKSNLNTFKLFLTGLASGLIGYLLLNLNQDIITSFAGLFFILLGLAFTCPQLILIACIVLKPIYKSLFGFVGSLSLRSISSQLSRTSIAIATLMIAISVSIGLSITIKSFRDTVENWLDDSLRADIYISSPRLVSNKAGKPLEKEFLLGISDHLKDDLKETLTYRNLDVNSSLGGIQLASIKTSEAVRSLMEFKTSLNNAWQGFKNEERLLLISEPLAYHHHLKPGDKITISTKKGDIDFKVGAVFYDYGSERGIAMMANTLYQDLFLDDSISSIGLIVKETKKDKEAFVNQVINKIKTKFNDKYMLYIRSNFKLKSESMEIFDRTFKVTNVLKIIAIIVAFIAVLSAFMSLQLERVREFAVLRANGVSPQQITTLLTLQTCTMGIFAAVLAIPAGLIQAYVMVFIINQRSFGWSLNFSLENDFYIEALIYAFAASLLAVIYPIYYTNSVKITGALRNE